MMQSKYGKCALIAGGSEGIGAAFAYHLAAEGMELILIALEADKLKEIAQDIKDKFEVSVTCINYDLSNKNAAKQIHLQLVGKEINILIYNAALSYIGHFEDHNYENHNQIVQTNVITPMNFIHVFAPNMLKKRKGAIIVMASLAGFQGSGFISVYAASKAFNQILAESLWYEWKGKGVDVLACCAGATSTPNYIRTNPEKTGFFAPRVLTPEEVVTECFKKLGKMPSFVTGTGNKLASFIMQRLLPRKKSITIMGNTIRKIYRI